MSNNSASLSAFGYLVSLKIDFYSRTLDEALAFLVWSLFFCFFLTQTFLSKYSLLFELEQGEIDGCASFLS